MSSDNYSVQLSNADDTRSAGASLGVVLSKVNLDQALIVHLNGELGAGKTTFVGGVLNAMGYAGAVRSPTYTLIEPYEFNDDELSGAQLPGATLHVIHMDLYRLTDASQLEELGVRDMLVPNTVLLIEWPERAGERLPNADLVINLAYLDQGLPGRKLECVAHSAVAKQLLRHVQSQYISHP